jgi:hypothetical protein
MTQAAEQLSRRGGRRAGSGRKPRDTRQVTLRLSPQTIRRLHEVAKELSIPISEVVEHCLKEL